MRTGYRLMLELNHSYNMDCMQGMAQFPDGYFDLAVVDPPYGGAGNMFKCSDKTRFGGRFDRYRSTAPAVQNLAGGGGIALPELAAPGGEIRQKNHSVGQRATPGIL